MQNPNYKKKYLDLRSKYINDLDMAFRLGVEQGMQQAQQQQSLDAEARANEKEMQMHQASMGGGANPENPNANQEPGAGPSQDAPSAAPEANPMDAMQSEQRGSELDQHIGKLEGMLGSDSSPEVQKSLNAIVSLRKDEKMAAELRKSQASISAIAKNLHKPAFKLGVQASHNLNDNAKKSVSMQHKIVNDIMKSWKTEEQKAASQIENILNVENLLKE